MAPEPLKRRFAPVPVETSTKSSKPPRPQILADKEVEGEDRPAKKTPRKFAVEPVETVTKKNHHVQIIPPSPEESQRKPRRFAVEPTETTTKTSQQETATGNKSGRAPRKFAVQPVETTSKRSTPDREGDHSHARFAPQPVEQTRRRRRSYDEPQRRNSELDETPADIPVTMRGRSPHQGFGLGAAVGATEDGLPARRSPLPHERRKERTEASIGNVRSHSFMCPDLETIASSESEPSEQGSRRSSSISSHNSSPLTIPDGNSDKLKGLEHNGMSSKKFNKYMKALEKQRAEVDMHEQALAAFPNSDFHQPVEHYVDEESDGDIILDDRPSTWEGHEEEVEEDRRLSSKRSDRLSTSKDEHLSAGGREARDSYRRKSSAANGGALRVEQVVSPWWNPASVEDVTQPGNDSEMSNMLQRARPPMLGADLRFPRSQSPEPARFDVTQGSHALRNQMCYLTEQAAADRIKADPQNGLWGGASNRSGAKSGEGKGLWGGFCAVVDADTRSATTKKMPSGLVTPAVFEKANPFDEDIYQAMTSNNLRPPPPPHARTKMIKQGIIVPKVDSILNSEAEVAQLMKVEYPDSFITQVFNYLSLGYPSLARAFDDELSKITSIPVAELRQDDVTARKMPKGYIRIGEDFQGREDGSDQTLGDGGCVRWRALKVYIKEWAKQEKGMVEVHAAPWGAPARKGSWAW